MGRTRVTKKKDKEFVCYALVNSYSGSVYTGQTNDFSRRLRQHRGEIAGGAKTTHRLQGECNPIFYVKGFATAAEAIRFERDMKRASSGGGGKRGRVLQLKRVLAKWNDPRLSVELFISQEEFDSLSQ